MKIKKIIYLVCTILYLVKLFPLKLMYIKCRQTELFIVYCSTLMLDVIMNFILLLMFCIYISLKIIRISELQILQHFISHLKIIFQ